MKKTDSTKDIAESYNKFKEFEGKPPNGIGSFNDLQQRLNRKSLSKDLLTHFPAGIILYDILWNKPAKEADQLAVLLKLIADK